MPVKDAVSRSKKPPICFDYSRMGIGLAPNHVFNICCRCVVKKYGLVDWGGKTAVSMLIKLFRNEMCAE